MTRPPASITGITTLRLSQVVARTGLSKSNIYERLNPKSPRYDPTFPRQFKLGISAVGWIESEIEAWLVSRAKSGETPSPRAVSASAVEEFSTPIGVEREKITSRVDQDLFAMRVATVRKFLEKRAKTGTLVRYVELMERTMLSADAPGDWVVLDTILSDISRKSYAENNVLLAAHVREKNEPSDSPREYFFDLANELGLQFENKDDFMEKQLKELFGYYSNPKFRTDEKLMWLSYSKLCTARIPD